MKKGTLRPNGITLASFEADFVNPPTGKMTAKAAFVNSETGATHGLGRELARADRTPNRATLATHDPAGI